VKTSDQKDLDWIDSVTILTHPIMYMTALFECIVSFIQQVFSFVFVEHWMPFSLLVVFLAAFVKIDGPHEPYRDEILDIGYFIAYWLILGIASSVGLGTGLHTFMLYLGPHIATVTLAANECGYVPEQLPSRWRFKCFEKCKEFDGTPVTFWEIFPEVFLPAFIWGAGTALGELPPYFVARAASMAGNRAEELDEVLGKSEKDRTKWDNWKIYMINFLKKYAFITVLIGASIPNPLFDLAGLTCGHFQIPFTIFFTATFIGKAVNKVSIQVVFFIIIFSKHMSEYVIGALNAISPSYANQMRASLAEQQKALFGG